MSSLWILPIVGAAVALMAVRSLAADAPASPAADGPVADKPLFRDPVEDGAADPTPIWNSKEKKWFIFYTNRRAKTPIDQTPGVTWVHGTHIGIAESVDGAHWTYRGIADIQYGDKDTTFWAPDVIENDGTYHMYLTVVPGIFTDWNHPRNIMHFTSDDLLKWKYESTLKLATEKVIDACVLRLPDGTWRMWYNEEKDGKAIYVANSPDLYKWTDGGKVLGSPGGEGPITFKWKGSFWLIKDIWKGLAVYKSDDAEHWKMQDEVLLSKSGAGEDDSGFGHHAGVEVCGDRVYLFYFTHPGQRATTQPSDRTHEGRRSSLQLVELQYNNGTITCDRNKPTHVMLTPPGGRE